MSLKIKDKFIGTKIIDKGREFILSNDLDESTKKYINKMVTSAVFEVEPAKEIKVSKKKIEVVDFDKPVKKEEKND